MCNEYNGYTNKPTWLVELWIDNDQYLQSMVYDLARDAIETNGADQDGLKDASYDLGNQLEEYFTDEINPLTRICGMYNDLLGFALATVNWQEIAANMIEAVQDEFTE